MERKKLALSLMLAGTLITSSNVHSAAAVQLSPQFQKPAEPSTPERGYMEGSEELTAKLDPSAPCEATWTDYGEAYMKWVEKPPSVLNECGLGRLVNFKLLQGFDPFGAMINAIKGAVCGFIKNEISDPFVNKLNAKISQANRWVDDTNNQYSSWIDETARDLGHSIYDPRSNFVKNEFPEGAGAPIRNNPYSSNESEPAVVTPIDPGDLTDTEILDSGGSISVGTNDSGNDVIVTGEQSNSPLNNAPVANDSWETLYNLYD